MPVKIYTPEDLKQIIDAHRLWLRGDLKGVQANLRSANLRSADLRSANLRSANLRSADLSGADLSGANLSGADLRSANLSGADLSGANLRSANLRSANLSGADLSGADLRSANLSGADLNKKTILPAFQIVPSEGAFIGWKSVLDDKGALVLKLQIPEDAQRVSTPIGRKCRASAVVVLEASRKPVGTIRSRHDSTFTYQVGERATALIFDDSIFVECTSGLHFFVTKAEAVEYGQ